MKRIPVSLFPVFLFILAAILFSSSAIAAEGLRIPGKKPAVSSDRALADWDWKRLRNPSSNILPPNIRERELQFARKAGVLKPSLNPSQWVRRGPYNIAGKTRAIGIDVSNEQVLFAGGVSGGMWRSANQGLTWTRVTSPNDIQTVSCLVQDTRPGKTNVWYYGTGELIGNSTSDQGSNSPVLGNGIFKSVDNGLTWKALSSTVTKNPAQISSWFQVVHSIALDPSNAQQDEIYAACAGAILRSTDGGETWRVALGATDSTGSEIALFTDVAVTSTGVVYATLSTGTGQGIWASPDGVFWESITPDGWPETGFIKIGIAPTREDLVYFFAYIPGYGVNDGVLLRWSGNSWTDLSENLPYSFGTYSLDHNMVIKVSPGDENLVFLGDTNLWRSPDGFTTPDKVTRIGGYSTGSTEGYYYPNHHTGQHALAFLPSDPRALLSGTDGGVSGTLDCTAETVEWVSLNNGLYTTEFYSAAIDHATKSPMIMGGIQNWGTFGTMSPEATDPWDQYILENGGICYIADNANFFYGASESGIIYLVYLGTDGSITDWALVTPAGGESFLYVTPYVMDPNDNKVIYVAAGNVIWRNSDVSKIPPLNSEPTSINYSRISSPTSTGAVSALGISRSPANILYYGTDSGEIYRVDQADAKNPEVVDIWTGKGLPDGAFVNCLWVDPQNADQALAIFSNYEVQSIFHTGDGGKTWTSISGNLEENPDGSGAGSSVRWATHLHTAGGDSLYFVGTSTGLYSTNRLQGSQTAWSQESPDLIGNMVIDGIDSRSTDNLVVVATHGGGVFSANAVVVGVKEDQPVAFALMQNVPNPFNPSTAIEFTLSASSHTELTVYDILGRKVRTLVNETRPAGTHKAIWDGRDSRGAQMAGGVYFYRLEANGAKLTRRMVFLK